uniref:Homeobox domain-containing protein n=2 Tax=Chrysotila carterae TaxID=13221 RepID=A0A7S4B669_CHRCT
MGAIGVYDLESQIAALHANLDQLRNSGQNEHAIPPVSVPQGPALVDPTLCQQYVMPMAQSICPADAQQLSQSKLRRWNIRDSDLQLLETAYMMDNFPSIFVRQQLASELGVSVRQVQVWFQNRRQRSRDKCREDSGGEKGSNDQTTDINAGSQVVDKPVSQPVAIDISQLLSRCEQTAEGLAVNARPRSGDADSAPSPRKGSVGAPVVARRPSDQNVDDTTTSGAAAPQRKIVSAIPVVAKSPVVQDVCGPAAPANLLVKSSQKAQNVGLAAPVEAGAHPPPVKTVPTAVSTVIPTAISLAQAGQLLQCTAPSAVPPASPSAAPLPAPPALAPAALAPSAQNAGGKRSRRGKMLSEARAPGMLDILMSQRAKAKNEAAMAQMMQKILASRGDAAKAAGALDAAIDAPHAHDTTFQPSFNASFGAGNAVLPAALSNAGMPKVLANEVHAALPANLPTALSPVNTVASNVALPSMPAQNGAIDRPHPIPQPMTPNPPSIPFEQLSQLFQSMQAPPAAQQPAPFSSPMNFGAGGNIDPQAFAHACQELARMALSLASKPQAPPVDIAAGHRQPAYQPTYQPAYLPTPAHHSAHHPVHQQSYVATPQLNGHRLSQPAYISVPPSPSMSSEASYTMLSRSVSMLPECAASDDYEDHASDRLPKAKRGRYTAHDTFSRQEQPCPPSPSSQVSSTSTQDLGLDFYTFDAALAAAKEAAKYAHMAPPAATTDLSDEENDELLSHLSDAVFDALQADF